MNYRFTGHDARFYPDIRDSEGKSLMAVTGTVFDFEGLPPSDGLWVPVEASNQPDQGADMGASPEPAREASPVSEEAPEPAPAPVTPAPVPEPSPVAREAVQEAPAPEPPAPVATVAPPFPVAASATFPFPGFAPPSQPYTR